jgi:hypothetical protein
MKQKADPETRELAAISQVNNLSAVVSQTKLKSNGKRATQMSVATQLGMFVTLTFSVIASRFVDYYRAAVSWSPIQDWQYLLFALIVSLTAFPLVYEKVQRNRNDPMLVQLGLIFAAGIGWEKILSTATDLLKPLH